MFECADAAFLIGAYPSPQVGSGDAVVVCGTLLAAYMQVVEYGLVFEVYKLIQQTAVDITTDRQFPNQLRPEENPGYRTRYKP